MRRFLFGACLVVAVFTITPTANATPAQDQQLYNAMASAGISITSRAIPAAYEVCSQVWAGIHPEYVAAEVASANPQWYFEQAEQFVRAAILVYCPPTRSQVA